MQIIGVNFKDRYSDAFQDKVYNYYCAVEDVAVGDVLIAPTSSSSGNGVVRVCAVDVDPATIAPNILKILKTITDRAEPGFITDGDGELHIGYVAKSSEPDVGEQTDLITVKQLPVIEDQLRSVKEEWDSKLQKALALPCTPETVKEIKQLRTDMRKDFFALDTRRKEIKEIASAPIKQFETTFKECIGDPFATADQELKQKIDSVEDDLKNEKRVTVEKHYAERLAMHDLDFPAFVQTGIKVGLSDSETSLLKRAEEFADRIAEDVEMIKTLPFADEIIVEYKASLNASRAISVVNNRHKAMEEVRQRMDVEPTAAPVIPTPPPEIPHIVVQTKADDETTVTLQVTGNKRQIDNLMKFLDDSWYTYMVVG